MRPARSGATRRVHPKRLHAVAAAFLAYEPFDEARDGGAGLLAVAWQIALANGAAVAAAEALHANAPDALLRSSDSQTQPFSRLTQR